MTLHPRNTGHSAYQMTVSLSEAEYWTVVHRARLLGIARSELVRRMLFVEHAISKEEATPDGTTYGQTEPTDPEANAGC